MTKATHTPGPWFVGPYTSTQVSCEQHGIASAGGWDDTRITPSDRHKMQEANARLIAAAPDLLEALELWHDWISGPGTVSMQTLLHMTDAAIAKAKGEA